MTEDELRAVQVGELVPLAAKIEVVDYDPAWPDLFARGAARIVACAFTAILACGPAVPHKAPASGNRVESGSAEPAPAGGVEVCLALDAGGLGDRASSDEAYKGLLRAQQELGARVHYVVAEAGDSAGRERALRQCVAHGDQLVIGIGFAFSDDLTKLAQELPQVRFAGVEYSPPLGLAKVPANLLGLRFREHEGSFLVGAIAGRVTQSKKVGFIGGMKTAMIRKYEVGYEAGVKHVCPDCQVFSAYTGTDPKAFSDPEKGREIALVELQLGVDIIYEASARTGEGIFGAAREQSKQVIGAEYDRYDDAPCCMLTSMIKNVDVAVFEAIKQVVDDRFRGGEAQLGAREGGVGFVYDEHNKARIPQAVLDEVKAIAKQIGDGAIRVPER